MVLTLADELEEARKAKVELEEENGLLVEDLVSSEAAIQALQIQLMAQKQECRRQVIL